MPAVVQICWFVPTILLGGDDHLASSRSEHTPRPVLFPTVDGNHLVSLLFLLFASSNIILSQYVVWFSHATLLTAIFIFTVMHGHLSVLYA